MAEHPRHFVAREDDRQSRRALGPDETVHPLEAPAEYRLVEKEDGAQRLILCRGRHASRGQSGEKRRHVRFTHLAGVARTARHDEAANPSDARLFGAGGCNAGAGVALPKMAVSATRQTSRPSKIRTANAILTGGRRHTPPRSGVSMTTNTAVTWRPCVPKEQS